MTQDRSNRKQRDRIGVILYVSYLMMLCASALIIGKILYIQTIFKPNDRIQRALTPPSKEKTTDPVRGNILDCNGNLLAISSPTYQIGMDCTVRAAEFAAKTNEQTRKDLESQWRSKAKELCVKLAGVFPEKTPSQYYKEIIRARESGRQYLAIGKPVDRATYNEILTFPLFREGPNKGGLVVERKELRTYPYGKLARRTIGFVRSNELKDVTNNRVGLEGRFNYVLHGEQGHEWLRKTDRGYVHNFDSTSTQAVDGNDIRTTINIDYQDICDRALRDQLADKEDIEGACLVLMEVKTGAIRAMVNLTNTGGGNYEEAVNYAIGRKIEPGSVFKTVTLLSVLSDRKIRSLDETLPTNHGMIKDTKCKQDAHILDFEKAHGTQIPIIHGFEISSNYVFGTLAVQNYKKNPMHFIQNIYSYHLADCFDFDLEGLATPTVPTPETIPYWTNTTLGNMGFGYSTEETPLHILTFYNAIAGKGRMMKPYLVESIEKDGAVVTKRGPVVLNASICSKAVADTVTRALKAVAKDGTAKWAMMNSKCTVAGKTGTSFQTFTVNGKPEYADEQGRKGYRGTFVGFFPADDPQYSIISTVYSKPTNISYQGAGIPARAIKQVIDGLYTIDPYFRPKLSKQI